MCVGLGGGGGGGLCKWGGGEGVSCKSVGMGQG